MREICLPIPKILENEKIDIKLSIGNQQFIYHIESFNWNSNNIIDKKNSITDSLTKILNLKKAIENYDESWELIQIFTPQKNSEWVQVLYRQKDSILKTQNND